MSHEHFATRMISTSRNIRQRCQLKYSRHGRLNWDKWTDYDCIFASSIDVNGRQQNRLELHSTNNVHIPTGKEIDLTDLHSLTCVHGNPTKNEPKDILVLKIGGRRHRLGFDNVYDYNQWKTLLDAVYNKTWDMTSRNKSNDQSTVNMLYESSTAMRYRVHFADISTQEILALSTGECELIFDTDKLVLEQNHDKQYVFPRSSIRRLRLVDDDEVEFELGSRAPVQGTIRFRFETPIDARTCFAQWDEGVTDAEVSQRYPRERISTRTDPLLRSRIALHGEHILQPPPRPPPPAMVSQSTSYPYYNYKSLEPRESYHEYTSFQTLV